MPASDVPVSRRTAVGVVAGMAVATSLSGCTGSSSDRSSHHFRRSPAAEPDPDVALARRALARESSMLAQVTATAHAHPQLADALSGARTAHRAHVRLLADAVPGQPSSPSSSPTGGHDRRHAVPHSAGAALAALVRQEARLARLGRQSALEARSGSFARVLASAAAAAAQQVSRLTAEAGAGR